MLNILLRKVITIFFGRIWASLLAKIVQIDQYRSSFFIKDKIFEKLVNGRVWKTNCGHPKSSISSFERPKNIVITFRSSISL